MGHDYSPVLTTAAGLPQGSGGGAGPRIHQPF